MDKNEHHNSNKEERGNELEQPSDDEQEYIQQRVSGLQNGLKREAEDIVFRLDASV
jgi:hypothetical protein